MAPIRQLVLDVLKPHSPSTVEITHEVANAADVTGVNATLLETNREVQNLRLVVEGEAIDTDEVERRVHDLGGTVHSVDEVVAGETLVEYRNQPQGPSPS